MIANVIIQDKTHSPFIIFGGLFSRRLISQRLNALEKLTDYSSDFVLARSFFETVTNGSLSEERLRYLIAQHILRGVTVSLPKNSQRDICYSSMIIEVKNEIEKFDLELLDGSIDNKKYGRKETAVEELFRYLVEDSVQWGVLTTGRIYRFYNLNSNDQFIEFDLFDILASGDIDNFNLFKNILINAKLRDELYSETKVIREEQAKNHIKDQLNLFLTDSEKKQREKATDKLVTFLSMVGIRYLEDIGCLPILSSEYAKYSLEKPENFTADKILSIISKFQAGYWFNGIKQPLLSNDELEAFEKVIRTSSNLEKIKKIFIDHKDFDYSDILIDQLGGVYQEIVNKNSEGAYYTPFVIGKKISTYLKNLSERKKIDFENDSNKVIVDIACGSGQLLRALVPSSSLFFKNKGDYQGKNSLRRKFIERLVGIDKDPNSVFICKISLALFAAEEKHGLSFPKLTKMEDTLEAFCSSRSNFIEIKRSDIFSIVANPPWESLEFNESNLYRKVTGKSLPKKSSEEDLGKIAQLKEFDVWVSKNKTLIQNEKKRIDDLIELCEKVGSEHKEYFEGKKNTALVFMFIIHKIIEQSNGSYVVVLPDRFFLGDTTPVRDKIFSEIDAYIPFQNCGSIFDGVDKGTRFGILFGRNTKGIGASSNITLQIPVMDGLEPVDFKKQKIAKTDLTFVEGTEKTTMLPFFKSTFEVELLNKWISRRHRIESWGQGCINLGARNKNSDLEKSLKKGGKYKIVKSLGRVSSTDSEFKGVLNTPFGASLSDLPANLKEHYSATKLVSPNVKRNGVRKFLVSSVKNCIVEHAYNFNEELGEKDLPGLQSMVFNSLVNVLAGAYNINSGMLNLLGTIQYESDPKYYVNEIKILEHLGFSKFEAVSGFLKNIISEFPFEVKIAGFRELNEEYPEIIRQIDLSKDEDYAATIAQRDLFGSNVIPLDLERASRVSAYIMDSLRDDKEFGRVKFAKVLYLTEYLCEEEFGIDWQRKRAGPYNKDVILKLENNLEKENLFEVQTIKVNDSTFYKYKKKARKPILKPDLQTSKMKRLNSLLQLFKGLTTDKMEMIATAFAVWNDLIIQGKDVTDKMIVFGFFNEWHTSKKTKFSEEAVLNEIQWMRKNNLTPSGFGKATA